MESPPPIHTWLPSGVTTVSPGGVGVWMSATSALVAVLITATSPPVEPFKLGTYSSVPTAACADTTGPSIRPAMAAGNVSASSQRGDRRAKVGFLRNCSTTSPYVEKRGTESREVR